MYVGSLNLQLMAVASNCSNKQIYQKSLATGLTSNFATNLEIGARNAGGALHGVWQMNRLGPRMAWSSLKTIHSVDRLQHKNEGNVSSTDFALWLLEMTADIVRIYIHRCDTIFSKHMKMNQAAMFPVWSTQHVIIIHVQLIIINQSHEILAAFLKRESGFFFNWQAIMHHLFILNVTLLNKERCFHISRENTCLIVQVKFSCCMPWRYTVSFVRPSCFTHGKETPSTHWIGSGGGGMELVWMLCLERRKVSNSSWESSPLSYSP